MRLPQGLFVDVERTLGALKFESLRRERKQENEEGKLEIKKRTYDLRCRKQGMMIQVSLPVEVPLKTIEPGSEVQLVNPRFGTVVNVSFRGAEVDWYIDADDIIAKSPHLGSGSKPMSQPNMNQDKK